MTKKKKGANEDKIIETKSKNVSGKSQKQKKPVEIELKPVEESLKEEDLLQESGTDSDYDGDVFFSPTFSFVSSSLFCIRFILVFFFWVIFRVCLSLWIPMISTPIFSIQRMMEHRKEQKMEM